MKLCRCIDQLKTGVRANYINCIYARSGALIVNSHIMTKTKRLFLTADVDDMIIAGNSVMIMQEFKEGLAKEVKIKDLGKLRWILGIQVE